MAKLCYTLVICAVLFWSIGCAERQGAAPEKTPAEEMMAVLPDNVLAFVATSGGDSIKPTFEKSILGRLWYDPEVQTFYQSTKKELLAKIKEEAQDANEADVAGIVLDFVESVADRPIIVGAAQKEAKDGPPVYGFAILDASERKAEIAAKLAELEALDSKGDIVEVNVGSLKMHGPKDSEDVPGYWGWVGNYFVFAVNDGEGLAIKYLQQPRKTAPDYLKKVPGTDDALAVYIDCQKIAGVIKTVAEQESATEKLTVVTAVIEKLGLTNVGTITSRLGFAGPDVVCSEFLEVPQPRTGLPANLKTINLKMFDMVDVRAVRAVAVNCDIGGMYDTIMTVVKAAAPNDVYTEIQEGIAELELQVQFKLRKGLLESLAGPMVFYALPAGVMMEAPNGGVVVIAKLKDKQLLEKTIVALGNFATAKSKGVVRTSSQTQSDGRTLHSFVIAPLALMGAMPCWMVVDDHIVIASSAALHKAAVTQMTSAKAAAESIRTTEGYKKATAKLPDKLIYLSYTDSQVQFKQLVLTLQQFWPMLTMVVAEADVKLPAMLPSADEVVKDMGPSCQYSWFDAKGLHSHYRGSGIEVSVGAAAGLGAGILMPALARTRQIAKRLQSGTNLSGIGKACLIYAYDHDDKLPPNLEELIEKAELSPKSLESPRKPKGFDGPSYIYIPGQTIDMEPGNIIAYDNPEFCTDKINVLFMDCHVQAMKPDEFLRDLEATYKRLGREMPEIKFKGIREVVPVEEVRPIPEPVEK